MSENDSVVARVRKLGVRETARRAKLSPGAVSQWIRGKIVLPRSTADRIVAAVK